MVSLAGGLHQSKLLEKWPEPTAEQALASFHCFVNYLPEGAVLHHPDYVAASVPWATGRLFEIFVAARYDSGVLCCVSVLHLIRPHRSSG